MRVPPANTPSQPFRTKPGEIHDLLTTHQPHRVVVEIGSAAGWVHDMALTMGLQIQVANPNHEAWRWKNVKRKTDKDDALKLAQLSAMNQLPTLQLPSAKVRQWRSLIGYRNTLVARRTAIKNHIRSLLDRQGMSWPGGKSGWTDKSIAALKLIARFPKKPKPEELWRFELRMELEAMAQAQTLIDQVEDKLDELAKADARVQQLQTIPGVGPRLAEVVVAVIDDAQAIQERQTGGSLCRSDAEAVRIGHDEPARRDQRPGQQAATGAVGPGLLAGAALQRESQCDL